MCHLCHVVTEARIPSGWGFRAAKLLTVAATRYRANLHTRRDGGSLPAPGSSGLLPSSSSGPGLGASGTGGAGVAAGQRWEAVYEQQRHGCALMMRVRAGAAGGRGMGSWDGVVGWVGGWDRGMGWERGFGLAVM